MEISIEDVRTMIGGYVLELLAKDKEIRELKTQIEGLSRDNASPPKEVGKIHALESPEVLMRRSE